MAINTQKLGFFNLLIFFLSLYVLGALAVDTIVELPAETSRLLQIFDWAICIVFFLDFIIQLISAKNKLEYLKWGWIDLLASIPMLDIFRWGRMFRMIRILRLIKAFKSLKGFLDVLFLSKAKGTLQSVLIIAILMILFCSLGILQVETDPESNIRTAGDALWWSFVTITTVGYGDYYPVTLEGRLIAVVLMTTGVGLFGTFTAFVASWFVKEVS